MQEMYKEARGISRLFNSRLVGDKETSVAILPSLVNSNFNPVACSMTPHTNRINNPLSRFTLSLSTPRVTALKGSRSSILPHPLSRCQPIPCDLTCEAFWVVWVSVNYWLPRRYHLMPRETEKVIVVMLPRSPYGLEDTRMRERTPTHLCLHAYRQMASLARLGSRETNHLIYLGILVIQGPTRWVEKQICMPMWAWIRSTNFGAGSAGNVMEPAQQGNIKNRDPVWVPTGLQRLLRCPGNPIYPTRWVSNWQLTCMPVCYMVLWYFVLELRHSPGNHPHLAFNVCSQAACNPPF